MSNRLPIANVTELKVSCQTLLREKIVSLSLPRRVELTAHNTIELVSVAPILELNTDESQGFAFYGANLTIGQTQQILMQILSEASPEDRTSIFVLKIQSQLGLDACVLNKGLSQSVIATLTSLSLDYIQLDAVKASLKKPGLIVMDMDSTTIEIECIDEIAKLYGVGQAVSEVTEQAMRGELDFSASLKARVGKLKGANEAILAEVKAQLPIMPGLESMLEAFYEKGWKVAIASGGFTYFADYLKERFQLYAAYANQLGIEDNLLTGEVNGDIVDAEYKAKVLVKMAHELALNEHQTIAIGDGANDLPMIRQASLGVAYHAKPSVQAQTEVKINHADLRALFLMVALADK